MSKSRHPSLSRRPVCEVQGQRRPHKQMLQVPTLEFADISFKIRQASRVFSEQELGG